MEKRKQVKITVGIPVYNGERFLFEKITSILNQSFDDFELIISDNGSTDSTKEICKNFAMKDKLIRFFSHKNNQHTNWNYNFILQEARGEYFIWTAVDDVLFPKFLEKNLEIMNKNKNVVCSISKIKLYGPITEYMKSDNPNKSLLSRIYKKIYQKMGYMDTYTISGNYENRIKEYLKNIRHHQVLYGLYRTEQIKKSFVKDSFIASDTATTFNLLKYGEIHVIDEILMEVYDSGMSRSGVFEATKKMNHKNIGLIFPFFPFTQWCIKNLGLNFYFKNLSFFIKITCQGGVSLFIGILRYLGLSPEQKFLGIKRAY